MKKIITAILLILVLFVSLSIANAENFPVGPQKQQGSDRPSANTPSSQYGYVPPPPIRHTWPGGYKVIFHELTNTLIDHMLGKY